MPLVVKNGSKTRRARGLGHARPVVAHAEPHGTDRRRVDARSRSRGGRVAASSQRRGRWRRG